MAKKKELPAEPLWHLSSQCSPPLGVIVLWYVNNKIFAGMEHVEADGRPIRSCIGDIGSYRAFGGPRKALYEEFTHWRWLPSEKPIV